MPPVALNCNGCPTTTAVSLPAKASKGGSTVTNTLSSPGLGHPAVLNVDSTQLVVNAGNATGFNVLGLFKVTAGDQLNEVPLTVPLS